MLIGVKTKMKKYYILVRLDKRLHLNYLFETKKLAMRGHAVALENGTMTEIVEVKLPVQ